jgi:hypothetical protein
MKEGTETTLYLQDLTPDISTIRAVKHFRKGEISKAEAILEIQASFTSGEVEPSNEELLSALSSYFTILNDIQEAA